MGPRCWRQQRRVPRTEYCLRAQRLEGSWRCLGRQKDTRDDAVPVVVTPTCHGHEEAIRKRQVQEFFCKRLKRRPEQAMAEWVNVFEKAVVDTIAERAFKPISRTSVGIRAVTVRTTKQQFFVKFNTREKRTTRYSAARDRTSGGGGSRGRRIVFRVRLDTCFRRRVDSLATTGEDLDDTIDAQNMEDCENSRRLCVKALPRSKKLTRN